MQYLPSLADRAARTCNEHCHHRKIPMEAQTIPQRSDFSIYATPSQVPRELVRCRVQLGVFPRQKHSQLWSTLSKLQGTKDEIILQLSHSLVNEADDERIPKEARFYLLP